MPFVSLTRLRIRSVRFLPLFALHALRSNRQVKQSPGFQSGALLPDRSFTFWTMTAWDTPESMRRYITTGDHKRAMPHLMQWCDEASVAHWEQAQPTLPTWEEADRRMRETGRPSKVNHQTPPRHPKLSPAPNLRRKPHLRRPRPPPRRWPTLVAKRRFAKAVA